MRGSRRLCALGFCALAGIMSFCGSGAMAADLRVGVSSEATTLDPHFFRLGSNMEVHKLIYSALVTSDARMNIVPDLAASWRAVDATHWEFRQRPGVTFHDGTPLTADDVVFTYQRARNVPNSPASFQQFLKRVKTVSAVDELTFIIETDIPDPILLNELQNFMIVSRRIGTDAATAEYNSGRKAIGTGPYRYAEWRPGDRLVLARNERHFGTRPEWDRVTYLPIANGGARVAALLTGSVDLINDVPSSDVPRLRSNQAITVSSMESNRIYHIGLDSGRSVSPFVTNADGSPATKNPMQDVRVRRALSMAIDRGALVSRLMEGLAKPASQLLPAGSSGTSSQMQPQPFDLAGARRLLTEAGYPSGFGITLHATNDRYPKDAEAIQAVAQMWSRLGLKVSVEALPRAVFFPRAAKLEFSAWLGGNSTDTGEGLSQLVYLLGTYDGARGFGVGNNGRYSNPELDAILSEASRTMDDKARNVLIGRAYELALGEDVAAIPMYFLLTSWAMRKGLAYDGYPQDMTIASLVRSAQ
jgi:peptide/nickel transport system substrate-binding protein